MIFDIYNPYKNQSVTTEYVSIIKDSLNAAGIDTKMTDTISKESAKKAEGIITITTRAAIKARKSGYKKVILWIQGVWPEESYMYRNSKLRYKVISYIEKKGIKAADFIFFCSDTMKKHYEKKYRLSFNNYYIMPCFNNEIDEKYFLEEEKYEKNTFVYAGSLAPWQCFEETVRLYKKIEEAVPNSLLKVLTEEKENAENVLAKYNIQNYIIDYVPQASIGAELAKAKFGFCLRHDNIVNNVATPTKLSTYVGHGIMPIFTSALEDFCEHTKNNPYCFCVRPEDADNIDNILGIINTQVSATDVYASFSDTFKDYFSKEFHIRQITKLFNNIFLQ